MEGSSLKLDQDSGKKYMRSQKGTVTFLSTEDQCEYCTQHNDMLNPSFSDSWRMTFSHPADLESAYF